MRSPRTHAACVVAVGAVEGFPSRRRPSLAARFVAAVPVPVAGFSSGFPPSPTMALNLASSAASLSDGPSTTLPSSHPTPGSRSGPGLSTPAPFGAPAMDAASESPNDLRSTGPPPYHRSHRCVPAGAAAAAAASAVARSPRAKSCPARFVASPPLLSASSPVDAAMILAKFPRSDADPEAPRAASSPERSGKNGSSAPQPSSPHAAASADVSASTSASLYATSDATSDAAASASDAANNGAILRVVAAPCAFAAASSNSCDTRTANARVCDWGCASARARASSRASASAWAAPVPASPPLARSASIICAKRYVARDWQHAFLMFRAASSRAASSSPAEMRARK